MSEDVFDLYKGDGSKADDRNAEIKPFEKPKHFDDAQNYFASPGLRDAVNVALRLGQPLLVTGEPGTGKTQLAASIAHEFDFELFRFNTKSNSTARDLFYHYDALGHFHDAQFHRLQNSDGGTNLPEKPPTSSPKPEKIVAESYIIYDALGLAILLSLEANAPERQKVNRFLPQKLRTVGPIRSVVLIDEIDKAPRDFPNDILNEIEEMSFRVKETDAPPFKAAEEYKPIVILTSNSEKSLPDAFLRRCIFYYIDFPDTKTLSAIVTKRLGAEKEENALVGARNNAIEFFEQIRKLKLRKPPATAEFLNWLRFLEQFQIKNPFESTGEQKEKLISTYAILLKNREDFNTVVEEMHSRQDGNPPDVQPPG